MTTFKNMLICLDLTEMDPILIKYAGFLAKVFRPQSITFMHVMETVHIPDEIAESFPDMDKPLNKIVEEEIEEKVETHFEPVAEQRTQVIVDQGITTENLIHYARKKHVDLAVLGKKLGYTGEGGIVRKLSGLIPSSVLLVSETTPHSIQRILVRMDFSGISAIALRTALEVANVTGAAINCHYVYKLPLGYFPEQSPAEIRKLKKGLQDYVQTEYRKFLKKNKIETSAPCDYSLDLHGEEAQILYDEAVKSGADMILAGSRIKSQLASVISDTTSDKLIETNINIPVMMVKDRKQTMGFLKSLFDQ